MTERHRDLAAQVAAGERGALARAITLVESRRIEDRADADALVDELLSRAGNAWRIGVSGVPGAGKSTLIDRLGTRAIAEGHKVAVLAVDPSSALSGGSILGDKTRMATLSTHERSFIRPSPTGGQLGGIARRTREAMLLCEAAGYDVIFVETVGVGQAEHAVRDMVDSFLVVLLAGAGDDLQAMKRGILELCDVVALNKADGDNAARAEQAAGDLSGALELLRPAGPAWSPRVLSVSALESRGIPELWSLLAAHHGWLLESGELARERARQRRAWLWSLIEEQLREQMLANAELGGTITSLEEAVERGSLSPGEAARRVLGAVTGGQRAR